MALGIVVATEDGGAVHSKPVTVRTIRRIMDPLPFLFDLRLGFILVTDRTQRRGDIVADTVVVPAGSN